MNKILNNKMILNWLYLDLNSYFASVEQQLQPKLQNKPIAIVPTMTDATCAIAASYEAKAYGVKTGTMIYEAKKLCPEIICVQANHENYVRYHHKILEEIDKSLGSEFSFVNLDKLFQVILKSATYEFLYKPNLSINIIIKEYLNASNFFLDSSQTRYLNALLDNVGKKLRS